MTTQHASAHVCTPPEPGSIAYTPRPAIIPAEHANQRRYGENSRDAYGNPLDPRHNNGVNVSASVYRPASRNHAELKMSVADVANVSAWMTPEELRNLARRLLDAAADIEELPSLLLTSGAQGALTRVLAVEGGAA